ncbi:MAG: hypothetical protein J7L63_04520, partial [Thermoplasmata archaeon]|nr:hypothetical protein [Thermoplasmata archaeon]
MKMGFFYIGVVGALLFLVSFSGMVVGWTPNYMPRDVNERMYYPGSDHYPQKFYDLYAEKYTQIYKRDIVIHMSYGDVKIGKLIFSIMPVEDPTTDDGYVFMENQRDFIIDIEVVYDAGNWEKDNSSVRYLDWPSNRPHNSWDIPPINAFYIKATKIVADFSEYYGNGWEIRSMFDHASAANWNGTWWMNGNVQGTQNWERFISKSERAQFKLIGIDEISDLEKAYERWRTNLLNQLENDVQLIRAYEQFTSWMSPAGFLGSKIGIGTWCIEEIYSMAENEILTEMETTIGELTGGDGWKWEWRSAGSSNPRAVASYIFSQPVLKIAEDYAYEQQHNDKSSDTTYDSHTEYFWHYKHWIVASHQTYRWHIEADKLPQDSNVPYRTLDIPLSFKVWFHYGPPNHGSTPHPFEFSTVVKITLSKGHGNAPVYTIPGFGLPLPTVKKKDGDTITYNPGGTVESLIINKGELYEFYISLPSAPVKRVSYYVDWNDGKYSEIANTNPSTNTYISHVWWNKPHLHSTEYPYIQLFAYYQDDNVVLLSQVFRIEIIWQDNGNTPGGGCPFLYTYNGGWREENNVLVWAENATRPFLNTVDNYLFEANEINGSVILGIGEPGEDVDFVDAVKLYRVYAPQGY